MAEKLGFLGTPWQGEDVLAFTPYYHTTGNRVYWAM